MARPLGLAMVRPPWADPGRGLFSISVAAELTGLHPHTLRLYEHEGLLAPARSPGGARRYSTDDIDRLQQIMALTSDGVNLAGVRRILQLQEQARRLQAELGQLKAAARGAPAARPAGTRQPGPVDPPLPGSPASRCPQANRATVMPAGNQHPPGRAGVSTSPSLAGGARSPAGGVAVAAHGGAVFPDLPQGDGQVGDQDDVIGAFEPVYACRCLCRGQQDCTCAGARMPADKPKLPRTEREQYVRPAGSPELAMRADNGLRR